MKSAAEWKAFYAEERASLGEVGLVERLERAPEVALPERGALVFPHTLASATGDLTAAVVHALLRSGADEVLALGVLHGGRAEDAKRVRRAKEGDPVARGKLRRVHRGDEAVCAEEFSLDLFDALLALASARAGKKPPRVHARYPFLAGDDPGRLPGMDEVLRLAERIPVVATTDPLHHGAGYGTPERARRPEAEATTPAFARTGIEMQLRLLARGDYAGFQQLAETFRSDFRDTGPVLAHALRGHGELRGEVLELRLVDYSEILGAAAPTWVAGPLMRFET